MTLLPTRHKRLNLLIWLKALGLGPVALTCAGKSDGGGAQVHAVLTVQAFCKAFGFTYLHTPFQKIEHAATPDEVARWEQAFALGAGSERADAQGLPIVPLKTYTKNPLNWMRRLIVALPHAHDYTDHVDVDYADFRARHQPPRTPGPLRIALHIRRGDVSASQHANRFTPDEKILEIIDRIQRLCTAQGYAASFHIYSQGHEEDFQTYRARQCHLHLNGDALHDLKHMATADVLLIAKSSFSYVAGLLCDGLVIYEPFWHRPGQGWIDMTRTDQMQQAIARLLTEKDRDHHMMDPRQTPILITGLVRNCAKTLEKDITRLKAAFIGHPLQYLLVESDSSDATVSLLTKMAAEDSSFQFESLGALSQKIPDRLQRITYCRNVYAERIAQDPKLRDTAYVAVADFDGINTLISPESIRSCWLRQDWDGVMANQAGPYYDIFALRHPLWSPNDCWAQYGFLKSRGLDKKEAGFAAVHSRMLRIPKDAEWIEVESAFGGLAIYRKSVFDKTRYAAIDEFGQPICEHVPFHRNLRAQSGRIFVNPALINSGYNEHTWRMKPSARLLRMPKNILRALLKPARLFLSAKH